MLAAHGLPLVSVTVRGAHRMMRRTVQAPCEPVPD